MKKEEIYIRPLELKDSKPLFDMRIKNKNDLQPFEPTFPADHFTFDAQEEAVKKAIYNRENDIGYSFGIFERDQGRIVGRVNLSNIVRGAWQNCTVGYYIDRDFKGKGFATHVVKLIVQFAFEEAHLHRVEAGVMPKNVASIRVVEKAGFDYIGLSKKHLKINGNWEDHYLYSITKCG